MNFIYKYNDKPHKSTKFKQFNKNQQEIDNGSTKINNKSTEKQH